MTLERWRGWNGSIYGLGIVDLGERRRAGRVDEAPLSGVNECVDIGGHSSDMGLSSSSMFELSNLPAFLRGARSFTWCGALDFGARLRFSEARPNRLGNYFTVCRAGTDALEKPLHQSILLYHRFRRENKRCCSSSVLG